jgi:hypothetical protein
VSVTIPYPPHPPASPVRLFCCRKKLSTWSLNSKRNTTCFQFKDFFLWCWWGRVEPTRTCDESHKNLESTQGISTQRYSLKIHLSGS